MSLPEPVLPDKRCLSICVYPRLFAVPDQNQVLPAPHMLSLPHDRLQQLYSHMQRAYQHQPTRHLKQALQILSYLLNTATIEDAALRGLPTSEVAR